MATLVPASRSPSAPTISCSIKSSSAGTTQRQAGTEVLRPFNLNEVVLAFAAPPQTPHRGLILTKSIRAMPSGMHEPSGGRGKMIEPSTELPGPGSGRPCHDWRGEAAEKV